MNRLATFLVLQILPLALLYPIALFGQSTSLIITPSRTTMLISESRVFRLVKTVINSITSSGLFPMTVRLISEVTMSCN